MVGRGEMPTERGDSWFSPKCIEVQPREENLLEVERCMGAGAKCWLPSPSKLRMPTGEGVSETAGAKLRRRKGNSPDHRLRSPRDAQWKRESVRKNSQDVGLEAATIERVRKSSLVECAGTENVPRLKHLTEAVNPMQAWDGRGALCKRRSQIGRTGGANRSANAGMSSVSDVRTITTESLRVPGLRQSSQGESGPKPRTL